MALAMLQHQLASLLEGSHDLDWIFIENKSLVMVSINGVYCKFIVSLLESIVELRKKSAHIFIASFDLSEFRV